jgi:quercetin dioxygenase-like cupin family protein
MTEETGEELSYEIASAGTRQYEWDSANGPGWIRVLVEEQILGDAGAEVIEVFFPPAHQGQSHYHELEIIYVIEGELEHIVEGKSHILTPGMIGIVRYPDEVIHKAHAEDGARVLVIWPLGNEVKGFKGMKETPIG